jgi:hypothetical protein
MSGRPLVVDLFSGTGSATQAFSDAGYDVFRVELDPQFPAHLHTDVRNVTARDIPRQPDFVWASPPCTSFSVGSFRHHWQATTECRTCGSTMRRAHHERWWHAYNPTCTAVRPGHLRYEPKSATGELGRDLLRHTLRLIHELKPIWWVLENPRALMRKMPELAVYERRTITHCQYGDPRRMKPTDLFGRFPPGFQARSCKNGDPCHEAAPRGARTGTQGLSSRDAAMLPPLLGRELAAAVTRGLGAASVVAA